MYTIRRELLKGAATSGRIGGREFEWCKKCTSYVKSVKMMGSYVGLIVQFILVK